MPPRTIPMPNGPISPISKHPPRLSSPLRSLLELISLRQCSFRRMEDSPRRAIKALSSSSPIWPCSFFLFHLSRPLLSIPIRLIRFVH
ncbi:uncharacterized protein BO97DRAFT_167320 [Aspergillus homomorphus CBS 101889]|uniref:Uncharacterized protein n=1 Tax=Aspergillus homomorphus (strain CBS 101889) TaxID=1450537 RepID=A0A395HPL6_ASPHC|nr:hypothetical protein BO97DRAFT_167320 [Aspergillus homomorphus CBS 101889]RAL09566.1 hypothetical protein BO97DRAFT_167320 [Aspergillus homomorphus CBS 101889]